MNVGSIYCVGRNYAEHAKELDNPVPDEPVIFTKTLASLAAFAGDIVIPLQWGRCDYETEVVVQVNQRLYQVDAPQCRQAIPQISIGLDLTLRNKQSQLKKKGLPWTLAKNFANACVLSEWHTINKYSDLSDVTFSLDINGQRRQSGLVADMLFSVDTLLAFISQTIPLLPGDIIMTGTPAGVGELSHGDQLVACLQGECVAQATIQRI